MISKSLDSDCGLYFIFLRFELLPKVDIRKIRSAWQTAFDKLQILRTKFMMVNGGYVQVALRDIDLPWIEMLLNEIDDDDAHCEILRQNWWERNRHDLCYPFEIICLKCGDRTFLILHMFHGLYDALSLSSLLNHVTDVYNDESLPNWGPAYADCLPYGPLMRLSGAKTFWVNHLQEAVYVRMPPLIQPHGKSDAICTVDSFQSKAFEEVRQKLKVTSQALLQACWTALLQQYLGGVITLGLVVSGRSIDVPGAADVIGPLFNTIPFSVRILPGETWRSLAVKCHKINIEALQYQHTSLRDVLQWTASERERELFDTLLSFQGNSHDEQSHSRLWEEVPSATQPDYALALDVQLMSPKCMRLTLAARADIADEDTLGGILAQLQSIMGAALQDPDSCVHDYCSVIRDVRGENPTVKAHSTVKRPKSSPVNPQLSSQFHLLQGEIAGLTSLPLSDIKYESSLFELGLDSIDIMKLSSRLRAQNCSLSLHTMMKDPLLCSLAEKMVLEQPKESDHDHDDGFDENLQKIKSYLVRSGLDLKGMELILPATPMQESMLAQMIGTNYEQYFAHDILELAEHINIDKLRDAWTKVHRTMPILRTSFVTVDEHALENSFAQLVHNDRPLPWTELEVRDFDSMIPLLENIKKSLQEGDAIRNCFALTLVDTEKSRYLVLSMSHPLYDGWSLALLHDDLYSAYHGQVMQRPDHSSIVQKICKAASENSAQFWSSYLTNAKKSCLQTPKHLPISQNARTFQRHEHVSSVSVNELESFCKKYRVTKQSVAQTCFALVLASQLQQLDVCFGVTISGRESEEDMEIMFPMMNTIAIRSVLFGSRLEMVQYMHDNFTSVRPHQQFPLRKALASKKMNRNSLFDTLFIYQKSPAMRQDDRALYRSVLSKADPEFALCVEVEVMGSDIIWRIACQEFASKENFGSEYLQKLDAVLLKIIDGPNENTFTLSKSGTSICGLVPSKMSEFVTQGGSDGDIIAEQSTDDEGLWSKTELIVRSVLSELASMPEKEIKKSMSIYHLGLDSISALKISATLRKRSIDLSVSEIIKAGDIKKMAKVALTNTTNGEQMQAKFQSVCSNMRTGLNCEDLLKRNHIRAENVRCLLPATPMQVYMLSIWHRSGGRLFYPTFVFQVERTFTLSEITETWQSLVAKIPTLRSIFLFTENSQYPVVQAILNQASTCVEIISETRAPQLSLVHEQPYAKLNAKRGDDIWHLELTIHHALYDATSLQIIKEGFVRLAQGGVLNEETPKPFEDYTTLTYDPECVAERSLFWKKYLSNSTVSSLAAKRGVSPKRTEFFRKALFSNVTGLERVAKKQGISVASILLAAYARLYFKMTDTTGIDTAGQRDAVIGVYLSNRGLPIEGLTDTTAPVLNLVPLRLSLSSADTLLGMANRVHNDLQEIGSGSRAAVALWEIKNWTGITVDTFVNFLGYTNGDILDGNEGLGASGSFIAPKEESSHDTVNGLAADQMPLELSGEIPRNAVLDCFKVNKSYVLFKYAKTD